MEDEFAVRGTASLDSSTSHATREVLTQIYLHDPGESLQRPRRASNGSTVSKPASNSVLEPIPASQPAVIVDSHDKQMFRDARATAGTSLASAARAIEQMQSSSSRLTAQMEKQLAAEVTAHSKTRRDRDTHMRQVQQLRQRASDEACRFRDTINALQQQVTAASAKAVNNRANLVQAQQRELELQEAVTELGEELATANQTLSTTQAKLVTLRQTIPELQAQIASLELEVQLEQRRSRVLQAQMQRDREIVTRAAQAHEPVARQTSMAPRQESPSHSTDTSDLGSDIDLASQEPVPVTPQRSSSSHQSSALQSAHGQSSVSTRAQAFTSTAASFRHQSRPPGPAPATATKAVRSDSAGSADTSDGQIAPNLRSPAVVQPGASKRRSTVRFTREVLAREAERATTPAEAERATTPAEAERATTSAEAGRATTPRDNPEQSTAADLAGARRRSQLSFSDLDDESMMLQQERDQGRLAPVSANTATVSPRGRWGSAASTTRRSQAGGIHPMRPLSALSGITSARLSDGILSDISNAARQQSGDGWGLVERNTSLGDLSQDAADDDASSPVTALDEAAMESPICHSPVAGSDSSTTGGGRGPQHPAAAIHKGAAVMPTRLKRERDDGAPSEAMTLQPDSNQHSSNDDENSHGDHDETILSHTTIDEPRSRRRGRGASSHGAVKTEATLPSRQAGKRRPLAIQSVGAAVDAGRGKLAIENHPELVGQTVELVRAAPKTRRQASRRSKVKQEPSASTNGASKSRTAVQAAAWDAPQEAKTPRLLAGARRKRSKSVRLE